MCFDLGFYKGKKVLVTGNTGFKGSWMSVMLVNAGAEVTGYSSGSGTKTGLFDLCGLKDQITQIRGDIRDPEQLLEAFQACRPEIVIHMAAQPIVRDSYKDPAGTFSINVMGTVNVCEAVRQTESVKSFLNVTTDKIYENKEWEWGYRETDPLGGYDPYSNSKSCSELVTHCYKSSFLEGKTAVSTVRAGNVIGGGDFAKDRIVPDCVRAAVRGEDIIVRNPFSVRPYQHVLDPVSAYLMIAAAQYEDPGYQSWYNVGPDDRNYLRTGELADLFVKHWGEGIRWVTRYDGGPHETNCLKIDCSRLRAAFAWKPRWDPETAIVKVVEWSKAWRAGQDVRPVMDRQIRAFLEKQP